MHNWLNTNRANGFNFLANEVSDNFFNFYNFIKNNKYEDIDNRRSGAQPCHRQGQ